MKTNWIERTIRRQLGNSSKPRTLRKLRVEGLEDRAVPSGNPPVASQIPRQVVLEDAAPLTVNLASFFTDPESDAMTFSAVQTNSSGLITPSITGSNLKLTFAPNGYGYSYFRVTANDGTGSTTSAFEVLVREVNDPVVDTATTSKSNSVNIDVLGNDGALDTVRLVEAANIQVIQNDTGNTTASVTVTVPQSTPALQIRTGSNRGDFNTQVGSSGSDDVANGMMLTSARENGRTNAGDTLAGARFGTPAIDSDAGGHYVSMNDSPNGGELNADVSAAYFPYLHGWLSAWGVNVSGTNGGANDTLRSATPNAAFTIGTGASNLVQDVGGGQTRISIPGISSQTDGLLLAIHGKNEDNYSLAAANGDGSWQIKIKDNGSSGAGLEQDPISFVYLPRNMPNVISGRLLGNGTVQLASGNFSISKTGTGTYTLSVPGQSPLTGVLILSPETTVGLGEDNILSYQASGSDFVIQTRDIVNTTAAPVLEDLAASTPVASFAFIPFLNSPAIRTTTAQSPGGTPNQSDLGATLTVNADGTVSYDPSTSATIQGSPAGSIVIDTFTYTSTSLTGQNSTATVTVTIAEGHLVDLASGVLSIKSTPGIDSNFGISTDGSTFTLTDPAAIFSLTQAVIDAGFSGAGTNSLTGPVAGLSLLNLDLGNGNDSLGALNGGSAAISVASIGILTATATIASTGPISLSAPTLQSTAAGLLASPSVQLEGNSIGTSSEHMRTQAGSVAVLINNGAAFVTELDGGNFTATATGAGAITAVNSSGTLNFAATSAAGNISATSTTGTLNVVGPVQSISGNLSLSSGNEVILASNVSAGSGLIAIAGNTDGVGSEGVSQTGGIISAATTSTSAVTITANTAGGGTGNISIDSSNVAGRLNVSNNAGNILYAGSGVLDTFQRGVQGNGGAAPTRVLKAGTYAFTATGAGSIGTDDRPIQSDNVAIVDTGVFAAGDGGVYWTDWGGAAFELKAASATGSGNVRVVTANASGHNLSIAGPVTADFGSIYLAADDNFAITSAIGDAGFSGTVYLAGNRDTGNTANLRMNAGASITTSNTSTSAVSLEAFNLAGTQAGGITLNDIAVGNGGRITANTIPIAGSKGNVIMLDSSVLLDAGATGQVVFITSEQTGQASSIGTAALPIRVTAGYVVATSQATSTSAGTSAGIFVTGTGATAFTASVGGTGTNAANIQLLTEAGILSVNGATATAANGTISLTGAGGVAINAPLSSATTGNITIGAGSNPATLASTLTINSNQTVAVTAANGLEVSSTGSVVGTGTTANSTPLKVSSGGLVSPAGTSVGTLNLGNITLAPGSKLRMDIQSNTSSDALNVTGTVDVTNSRLLVFVNGNLSVNDSFTVLTNDAGESITGQFLGGTTLSALNDPRYVFSLNYAGGDGNDVVATVSSIIATNFLTLDADGLITFAAATDLNNDFSMSRVAGNYVVTDTSGPIGLSPDAIAAGWSGEGTNTVTGPIAGVTGIALTFNNGSDVLNGVDAGDVPLTVNGIGSLGVSGLNTTTNTMTVTGVTDITGTGTLEATALNLTASNGIGNSSQKPATHAATIVASAGNGGVFLSEADGADFTVTTTGFGSIGLDNASGTLHIAGLTSTSGGSITLSSADAIALGANLNAGSGAIAISANTDGAGSDGYDQKAASLLTSNTNLAAVTIAVNTAGGGTGDAVIGLGIIGNDSGGGITVSSNAGNILWSNHPSYTAFTTAQTGEAGGGSNSQTLKAYSYTFNTGANGSAGTAARPVQLDNYGINGDVNTDPNLSATVGSGGLYVLAWDSAGNRDLTTGNLSAQGAGNILVAAGNAGGHNLWVNGTITTGSGSISLYADDEFFMTGTGKIGDAGFSGTAFLLANRDAGNGQAITMRDGAAILTSNAGADAVHLEARPAGTGAGTSDLAPQGGIVLTNITVGDGGTITVNAAGGTAAGRQGTIVQRDGTLLNAGATGTVKLLARANDSTGLLNTGNIGANGDTTTLVLLPVTVRAGTVIATTNGTSLGNTGVINVVNEIGGSFTATTSGNSSAMVQLATKTGVLTVDGATSNAGGPIRLTGADGVHLQAQLGSSNSGPITIDGALSGNSNIVLGTGGLTIDQDSGSTFDGVISGPQALTKSGTGTLTLGAANTYAGGTVVSAGGLLAENTSGSATGGGDVVIDDAASLGGRGSVAGTLIVSGTLAIGAGNATGTLETGNLTFGAAGARSLGIDINGLTAGTNYDQASVSGTIDLTGASLSVVVGNGFQPLLNDTFVILTNDGSDAITGEFTGVADGATFDVGNRTFEIDYGGGDGNDVSVKVTHITSGPPVNTVPGDQLAFEDIDLVFSNANANAISVADPEFGGPLKITLTATQGVLTLASLGGLSFSDGDGTADTTMTFVGLPTAINIALDGLRFIPDADYNGDATLSIVSDDQGGTGDAAQSDSDSVAISLAVVNDVPSFTKGSDQSILEDAGLQSVNGWATSIGVGPANEGSQSPSFLISTDNDALFSGFPSIDASGNLTYTTAADANGSATVTVRVMDDGGTLNGGVDTSDPQTFTIDVTQVNDVPTFTKGADQTINEDAGAQTVNGWASGVSVGPADEVGQTRTFDVSTDNDNLFSLVPEIDASGNLTFTPGADAHGSATVTVFLSDNGGTADGGDDTSDSQTFSITVNSVNDVPSFTKGSDETVLEDAGTQTLNGWATAIDVGPANESGQIPTFLISTNNDALFSGFPSIDASGNLTYTPAANANGSPTVTVRLMDSGGTADGGVDTSDPQSFTINVTAVNDVPTFTEGADQTMNEDAGVQTVNGWASGVSAGPVDEVGQSLSFDVSTNNNLLFSVPPAIDAIGNLTYTPALNAQGSATVTVFLSDNGGTADGGDDTSDSQTFTITVNSVNDVPSFTKGGDESVLEDAGTQTVNGWATSINVGPANESGQSPTFLISTNNDALFSGLPAIDASGNLSYTPAANANGSATVTVRLMDSGGTANGGIDTSDLQTFTIDVTSVNDVPTFTKGANQTVNEDAGAQTVSGWASGVSAGTANEAVQTLTFDVSNNNNLLFSVQPAIDASGNLTYTLALNAHGSATVMVLLSDNGGTANGGDDTSDTQTFTITVNSVNDSPLLNTAGTPKLPYIPVRGKVLSAGTVAGAILSDLTENISDLADGDQKGIAVTAINNTRGIWEYNLAFNPSSPTSGWAAIPASVSTSNALLLADDGDTRLRFIPNLKFKGFASLTFRAWDRTNSPLAEGAFETNLNTSAYSPEDDQAWIAVGVTKPAVDADGRTILKPVKSDTKMSSPIFVKDMIGIAGLETGKVNLGVAIIGNTIAEGTWEFQLAKTKPWVAVGAVSATSALLLKPTDKLRFVPKVPAIDGDSALTFLTWDQTSPAADQAGNKVIPTGSAFGSNPGAAILDLVPVLDLSAAGVLNPVAANGTTNAVVFSSLMNANHVVGTNLGVAITAAKGMGTWEYSLDGGVTWKAVGKVSKGKALFLEIDTQIRFKAAAVVKPGTARLSFKAWDLTKVAPGTVAAASGNSVSKQSEIVSVAVANTNPTLDATGTPILKAIKATAKAGGGTAVSPILGKAFGDLDSKSQKGIAITGFTDNGGGKWQYSVGASVWVDLGAVGPNSAVLLASNARVRYFVTNTAITGDATITYKAWDRSTGQSGDRGVDTTGLLNSFSTNFETATISVML